MADKKASSIPTPEIEQSRRIVPVDHKDVAMWYLESFDRSTQLRIGKYPLRGLGTLELRQVLELRATIEIGGIEYPTEAGGYDVILSKLSFFAKYLTDRANIEAPADFQVAYHDD